MTGVLVICIDGIQVDAIPLKAGDDRFNGEAERGALDRAYEFKEQNPDSVVSLVLEREPERPRVYMDARFDVTDLNDFERGQLAIEVQAQGEASDYDDDGTGGHPDVAVEIEWNEVGEAGDVLVPGDDGSGLFDGDAP